MITTDKPFSSIDVELQITEWLPPGGMSKTQYGFVTNMEWCAFEKERIGDACEVVFSDLLKMVCLRWDESEMSRLRSQRVSSATVAKGKRGDVV